jgi:hypothetical protein
MKNFKPQKKKKKKIEVASKSSGWSYVITVDEPRIKFFLPEIMIKSLELLAQL